MQLWNKVDTYLLALDVEFSFCVVEIRNKQLLPRTYRIYISRSLCL